MIIYKWCLKTPRPQCDNCTTELAEVECGQCTEFYCAECWDAVHFGGKRKGHKFRCLYDYYRRRIDYGDDEGEVELGAVLGAAVNSSAHAMVTS